MVQRFSIGINIVGAKQEGFHAELAVGESVDVSDFSNGEYNIIVGYNDGKVDDYSFGKIAISDESVELTGLMQQIYKSSRCNSIRSNRNRGRIVK